MQGIYKLPAFVLAGAAIFAGIAFIVMSNPPVHICDPQIARFKEKTSLLGDMEALLEECRAANSPGGCYPIFSYLRGALRNVPLVSMECLEPLKSKTRIKKILVSGLELMPLLAFRPEALSGKTDRLSWLGFSDINLFCKLKDRLFALFGKAPFTALESRTVSQIIKNLEESWEKSWKKNKKAAECPKDPHPICDGKEEAWGKEYQKVRRLSPSPTAVRKKSLFAESCAAWR